MAFTADLYYWLREFGNNLDDTTALSSAIDEFTPTLLGPGKVAQFTTWSMYDTGFWMASLGSILLVLAVVIRVRRERAGLGVLGAALLVTVLVVSSAGPYTSIEAALDAASPGDTIVVRGGEHPAVVLDKRVTLRGEQGAVLDGGGDGDVVRIEVPGVVLEGFLIQNSGRNLQQEHAGVTVLAADVVVRDNVLREVLFGTS